jgi:ribosomal protein L3 glutamine methyltransferase
MHHQDISNELHTIRDYLRWASSRFTEAGLVFGHGTDNPWDDAVQLACFVLHLPVDSTRELLDARLTMNERVQLIKFIERRLVERIPVPYITNRAWFANLEFYVDQRVIIPRSPTAELIEQHFSPWLLQEPKRILDLCTGSGCIAIACALAFPDATVDGVDIDENALAVAATNVERYFLQDRVTLVKSDLFAALRGQKYDLIVSNPPYVSDEVISQLGREFQHEPHLAFAGFGVDGLELVHKILQHAAQYLTDDGILICEVGDNVDLLESRFPKVPFTWIEFTNGGEGVFLINRAQLLEFEAEFA